MDRAVDRAAMLPFPQCSPVISRPRRSSPEYIVVRAASGKSGLSLRFLVFAALLTAGSSWLPGQTAPQLALSAVAPSEAVRPTLNRISEVLAGLNVGRWKAPSEVRSVTQRDVDSIQRDIASTLPPLLDQANATPASVASYFAVYRNIDALYDVLLRVSETATLAGSQSDADTLQGALSSLESSRRNLGDAILLAANNQQQELIGLRAAAAAQAAAAAAEAAKPVAPTKTVVVDGPESSAKSSSTAKKKKKPAPATTTVPAPNTPATTPQ